MVKAGCDYAVVEVASEGIVQFRTWGIPFDVAVFTNLSPDPLVVGDIITGLIVYETS
jgi:UDP-N-acetylmuramoyl-L-alanyl-D-glutamate--2,6-diaminopimelate ligase